MSVNPKVDSGVGLLEVPGLNAAHQRVWKVRLIAIHGRSPSLAALRLWEAHARRDFEKIMTAMRLIGAQRNPPTLPLVGRTRFAEVHEMRADQGVARLLYFYDRDTGTAVCVKDYQDGNTGEPELSVALCESVHQIYFSSSLSFKQS